MVGMKTGSWLGLVTGSLMMTHLQSLSVQPPHAWFVKSIAAQSTFIAAEAQVQSSTPPKGWRGPGLCLSSLKGRSTKDYQNHKRSHFVLCIRSCEKRGGREAHRKA